jgi:hypothetical protein
MKWESLLAPMLVLTLLMAARAGGDLPTSLPRNSSPEGTRTWEALNQPVKIAIRTDSLTAMLEHVAEQAGVEIDIHPQAFASAGVDDSKSVGMHVDGIRARSALQLLLRPLQLQYKVKADGRVLITAEPGPAELSVQTYDVGDLVDDVAGQADDGSTAKRLEQLRELVTTCVRPATWDGFGGRGSAAVHETEHSLVVRQTAVGHAEVTLLLERLREKRREQDFVPPPGIVSAADVIRQQIQQTLETTRISVTYHDAPLTTVIRDIAQQAGVNVLVDNSGLGEEGVTAETLVTLNVRDKLVVEVLGRLLEPLHLDYVLEDEVVKITGRMRALGKMTTVVYPVGNLVDLPADANQPVSRAQLDTLARGLQQQIMPYTWDEVGGFGSISPHESTDSLVIRQAEAVHKQIQDWLQAKREGIDR